MGCAAAALAGAAGAVAGMSGVQNGLLVGAVAGLAVLLDGFAMRGRQALRERDQGERLARQLYELTRRTLEMDLQEEPGARLAELVQEVFDLDGVAVFDADLHQIYEAGPMKSSLRELSQNVYHFETADDDRVTWISRRVVRLGTVPVGSLVLRGDTSPLINNAIAAVIAVTFDRYRATANESRMEAERQTEQMRGAVLDNLAHAYKTPLTAIRAASSGLSEMGDLSEAQEGLVALIDEQAKLLADLTTKLLTTARLEGDPEGGEASPFALHVAEESAGLLVEDVVESLADRSSGIQVRIENPEEGLVVDCDRRLMGMLLTQYLDNACKYADFDSVVTVRASSAGREVVFSVHSFGPVIPAVDRERIFDRYYRAPSGSRNPAGTGIGLSIAKRVAQAHGGTVWVTSDEAEGTTFFAAIPKVQGSGGGKAAARVCRQRHDVHETRTGTEEDQYLDETLERTTL